MTTEMLSRGQENDAVLVWREIILILFPTKLKIYCEGKNKAFKTSKTVEHLITPRSLLKTNAACAKRNVGSKDRRVN